MMPGPLRSLLLILLILMAWSPCALSSPLFAQQEEDSYRNVRVGVTFHKEGGDNPDDDKMQGFYSSLLRNIASMEGWNLEFVPGSEELNLARLQSGEIDLVTLPLQDRYQDEVLYSNETVLSTWGQIYTSHDVMISNVLDLNDKVIAVVPDGEHYSEFSETIRQFDINCEFVMANNYRKVFKAVDIGLADAGIVERTYGSMHQHEYRVQSTPVIFSPSEVRFAALEGVNRELILTIDYYLALFKRNSDSLYYRLIDDYFGPGQKLVFPTWLLWTLVALSVVFVATLGSVVVLRSQVRSATRNLRTANSELQEEVRVRKKQEKELLRLATVVEQMMEGVLITDMQGRIKYLNPAAEKITGYIRSEMIDQEATRFLEGPDAPTIVRDLVRTIRGGKAWRSRIRNRKPQGGEYEVEVSVSPIKPAEGSVSNVLGILRDVSHEATLERQLRQSQKLEAIGTLAGGIAHDFNNTLFSMLGFTDLALITRDDTKRVEMLNQVLKAGKRAKDLVKQILTFSRQDEQEKRIVEIQPVLKETMKLISPALPSTIDIKFDFKGDGLLVRSDPTQIHQILMNLCSNAAYAMEEGKGVLEVSLREVDVDKITAQMRADLHEGRYAKLTVRDNGSGIDRETLDRIFEPFYTTKPRGEGTGMGLAVVHGIVHSHGGAIEVYSDLGKGTTFHIFLPIVMGDVDEEELLAEERVAGTGSILVVDDEEAVAQMLQEVMTYLGYEVEVHTNSQQALESFREKPDAFDLMLTDLTMPNLTGIDLAREIHRIRAKLPIVLITGFGQGLKMEELQEVGIRELVQKPVLTNELAEIIRRNLEGELEKTSQGSRQSMLN